MIFFAAAGNVPTVGWSTAAEPAAVEIHPTPRIAAMASALRARRVTRP
jgi:hypothetical protein